MSYEVDINRKLTRFDVASPERTNVGQFIAKRFLWTKVEKFAKEKVKEIDKLMVQDKLVPPDDELRSNGESEKILVKTPNFVFTAKITNPRQTFNKEEFIERLCREFKLDKSKVRKLSEECVKLSVAPLSKNVIEV